MRTRLDHWMMRTNDTIDDRSIDDRSTDSGESVSSTEYQIDNSWLPVRIPNTIFGGLVEAGAVEDPMVGDALISSEGFKNVPNHFVNFPKPTDSPYTTPRWFRTTFRLPPRSDDREDVLHVKFHGISPGGTIWLNGRQVATDDRATGTYRQYLYTFRDGINWNDENVLAVLVDPATPNDLGITFIDWTPGMPDDSAGLWRPVEWWVTGPVSLSEPFLHPTLAPDNLSASIEAIVTVRNASGITRTVSVSLSVAEKTVTQSVVVVASGSETIAFDRSRFPTLEITSPEIWWPYELGRPAMYTATLSIDNEETEALAVPFGIRRVESFVNEYGSREFAINGVPLPIKGVAWSPDIFLRESSERDAIDLQMIRNLNINTVRLEGMLGSDEFWNLCDAMGILVMAGWPCCNYFERWKEWNSRDLPIAIESLRSQLLRLRNHPSLFVWLYGSDAPPPEDIERRYLDVLALTAPNLAVISSATDQETVYGGTTGCKMSGPYDYVPPSYWYDPEMPGSAERLNTETCPACALPIIQSIRRTVGTPDPEIGDTAWKLHCGGFPFDQTEHIQVAVAKRYGWDGTIEELAFRSQYLGYETWRAMYEAYRHRFPAAGGVIGWMLNSGWPSLIWQLYDHWYHPTGSFFGTQEACRPVRAYLSYEDGSIWILNDSARSVPKAGVVVQVYNGDLTEVWRTSVAIAVPSQRRISVCGIPESVSTKPFQIVVISLSSDGKESETTAYWVAYPGDTMGRDTQERWYHTPVASHADMSRLFQLPPATVTVGGWYKPTQGRIDVQLENRSDVPAITLDTRLIDPVTEEPIAPSYWNRNFVTLVPHGSTTITIEIDAPASESFVIAVTGPNVAITEGEVRYE